MDVFDRQRIEVVPAVAALASNDYQLHFLKDFEMLHHSAAIQLREEATYLASRAWGRLEEVKDPTTSCVPQCLEDAVLRGFPRHVITLQHVSLGKESELELKFQVYGRIAKQVSEVFDAVYNPTKLSGYFTTGGASGPLDEGTTVKWDFADFPGAFPVYVRKVEPDRLIVLEWDQADGSTTQVRMEFEPLDAGSTMVRISEGPWSETTQAALDQSYEKCMGWTQMIACMKVYLEHRINLRDGFFK